MNSKNIRLRLVGMVMAAFGLLVATASLRPLLTYAAQQPAAPAQSAAPAKSADAHPEFPMNPGRDTVLRLCSQCHSPNNILASGQDQAGWEGTITKMVGFGLQGTDEEFTEALDYLTKSFPPSTKINVNQATATQIVNRLALTTDEAQHVIAYRTKNGNFKTIDDLKKVPGVDPKKFDAHKDDLLF